MIRRLLINPQQAMGALGAVLRELRPMLDAGQTFEVEVRPPKKKRPQEEKYHAQIADIAAQSDYAGKRWHKDDMKRLLIDEFADEMRNAGSALHHDLRMVPSEDGRRVIALNVSSSNFYVAEASAFIEFLYSWGADRGVEWTEHITYKENA